LEQFGAAQCEQACVSPVSTDEIDHAFGFISIRRRDAVQFGGFFDQAAALGARTVVAARRWRAFGLVARDFGVAPRGLWQPPPWRREGAFGGDALGVL
jgi:hypothetical protein